MSGLGEVFVCDRDNHRVQVFGLDGTYLRQWGTQGAGHGQLNGPCGVTVSDGGEVFVCDALEQPSAGIFLV